MVTVGFYRSCILHVLLNSHREHWKSLLHGEKSPLSTPLTNRAMESLTIDRSTSATSERYWIPVSMFSKRIYR